jgi:hypothetical protein
MVLQGRELGPMGIDWRWLDGGTLTVEPSDGEEGGGVEVVDGGADTGVIGGEGVDVEGLRAHAVLEDLRV